MDTYLEADHIGAGMVGQLRQEERFSLRPSETIGAWEEFPPCDHIRHQLRLGRGWVAHVRTSVWASIFYPHQLVSTLPDKVREGANIPGDNPDALYVRCVVGKTELDPFTPEVSVAGYGRWGRRGRRCAWSRDEFGGAARSSKLELGRGEVVGWHRTLRATRSRERNEVRRWEAESVEWARNLTLCCSAGKVLREC